MSSTLSSEVSERWLLDRYRRDRDVAARDELVRRMLPLVRSVAGSYRRSGHDDDLFQVACLGLVNAIVRFDPSFGLPLRAYAVPTMHGEVRRYLRDHTWALHVPRPLQERTLATTKAVERITTRTGRPATAQQVADELGIGLAETLEALRAGGAYVTTSLDAPTGRFADGNQRTIADSLGAVDERLELSERIADLRALRDLLDERDRRVLYLRFVEDLTQTEIARDVGCSQMHVSRILRGVLARLNERATRTIADPVAA
jgi:RNA polymerase sigma-B factor